MTAVLLHFEKGVPIDDCDIRSEQKERLARVGHVYWQWVRNPFLDTFAMFKQLARRGERDFHHEWRIAKKDQLLFDFVRDTVAPPSRRVSEAKVRVTADRLMTMGAETDNGRDMAEGAKLLMKLDRLDQPENEQADMSKAMFLPPVVVTDISRMDDSKHNVDDPEMKRIMSKYGGVQDEKLRDMDEMVEIMEARSQASQQKSLADNEEE